MSQSQYFDEAARSWDENPARHELAHALFHTIEKHISLNEKMVALDFGAGTGLVTLPLARHVASIIAVDASPAMLEVLEQKARTAGINIYTQIYDGVEYPDLGRNFDIVVTTMVLHHIPEPEGLLDQFDRWLKPGGWLVIADLEPEDGSFHGDNPTVHHLGFDPQHLASLLEGRGMTLVAVERPHHINKPQPDGSSRDYPVFLTVARTRTEM